MPDTNCRRHVLVIVGTSNETSTAGSRVSQLHRNIRLAKVVYTPNSGYQFIWELTCDCLTFRQYFHNLPFSAQSSAGKAESRSWIWPFHASPPRWASAQLSEIRTHHLERLWHMFCRREQCHGCCWVPGARIPSSPRCCFSSLPARIQENHEQYAE